MDLGRIIIGLFLISNATYKLYQKRISWPRMTFSLFVGMGFILQAIGDADDFQKELYLSADQLEYWSIFDQLLIASLVFFLGRYIYEIRKSKNREQARA